MTEYDRETFRRPAELGMLLTFGCDAFRLSCLPPNAPSAQIKDMHAAFMIGAHYVVQALKGFKSDAKGAAALAGLNTS